MKIIVHVQHWQKLAGKQIIFMILAQYSSSLFNLGYVLSMFLNFEHFPVLRSYKKEWIYLLRPKVYSRLISFPSTDQHQLTSLPLTYFETLNELLI